jgi:hypothetical protein
MWSSGITCGDVSGYGTSSGHDEVEQDLLHLVGHSCDTSASDHSNRGLRLTYYNNTACQNVEKSSVRAEVQKRFQTDPSIAAQLIRISALPIDVSFSSMQVEIVLAL